jgi:hypothetical protein
MKRKTLIARQMPKIHIKADKYKPATADIKKKENNHHWENELKRM